jgi:hypothetical protein
MDDIEYLQASNGSGEAPRLTVTGARAPAATTLVVNAVTNWPSHFIATTGTLNVTTGLIDPATMKVFRGHTNSGAIQIDAFAPGYTDVGNSVGQVVVLKPNTEWADLVAEAFDDIDTRLGVSLDPDGTLTAAALLEAGAARKTPRITSTATTATLTPALATANYYRVSAQTTALAVANPTGTPVDGEGLLFEITGTAARAITWDTAYEANSQYGLALPTTTVTTKTTFITFVWSAARSKWLAVM